VVWTYQVWRATTAGLRMGIERAVAWTCSWNTSRDHPVPAQLNKIIMDTKATKRILEPNEQTNKKWT